MAASKHQSSILEHHDHIWKGTEDTLLEEEKHHEKRLLPLHVSEGPPRGSRESTRARCQLGGEQEEGISSNPIFFQRSIFGTVAHRCSGDVPQRL